MGGGRGFKTSPARAGVDFNLDLVVHTDACLTGDETCTKDTGMLDDEEDAMPLVLVEFSGAISRNNFVKNSGFRK